MRQNRTNLVLGVLLIVVGGWLLLSNQVPAVREWIDGHSAGALWTIGAGALILLFGLLTGSPGMAVPASFVAGIGGILYYQDITRDQSSWSYMWTLIWAFIGVGMILAGFLGENTRRNISRGLRNIVVSAVLFLIFGTLLGGLNVLGTYGAPILVILLGMYVLARGMWRTNRMERHETR